MKRNYKEMEEQIHEKMKLAMSKLDEAVEDLKDVEGLDSSTIYEVEKALKRIQNINEEHNRLVDLMDKESR